MFRLIGKCNSFKCNFHVRLEVCVIGNYFVMFELHCGSMELFGICVGFK